LSKCKRRERYLLIRIGPLSVVNTLGSTDDLGVKT
jgi:hypothetical protein